MENIDIDKAILQNIDIDKISNRFKFGISNRATDRGPKTLWGDQKKVDKGVISLTVIRGLNSCDLGQRAIIV